MLAMAYKCPPPDNLISLRDELVVLSHFASKILGLAPHFFLDNIFTYAAFLIAST